MTSLLHQRSIDPLFLSAPSFPHRRIPSRWTTPLMFCRKMLQSSRKSGFRQFVSKGQLVGGKIYVLLKVEWKSLKNGYHIYIYICTYHLLYSLFHLFPWHPRFPSPVSLFSLYPHFSLSPSNFEWDRIPTDPVKSKLWARAIIRYSGFFRGSVLSWVRPWVRFLGQYGPKRQTDESPEALSRVDLPRYLVLYEAPGLGWQMAFGFFEVRNHGISICDVWTVYILPIHENIWKHI